jgi:hypothetical protein
MRLGIIWDIQRGPFSGCLEKEAHADIGVAVAAVHGGREIYLVLV